MKLTRAMLVFMLLTGAGCVTFPSLKDEPAAKANPAAPPAAKAPVANVPAAGARPEPALPRVNPDEVTDSNAREKAEVLRRELSREDK